MVWSLIRVEVLRFEPSRVGYRVGGKTIELWSLDMQERGARAFKNPCGTLVTRKRRLQPLGSGCKTAAGIEMTAARPPWCSRPSRRRPSALPRMVRSDRSSVAPWKGLRPKDPKKMSQQKPLARGRRAGDAVRDAEGVHAHAGMQQSATLQECDREMEGLGHANVEGATREDEPHVDAMRRGRR